MIGPWLQAFLWFGTNPYSVQDTLFYGFAVITLAISIAWSFHQAVLCFQEVSCLLHLKERKADADDKKSRDVNRITSLVSPQRSSCLLHFQLQILKILALESMFERLEEHGTSSLEEHRCFSQQIVRTNIEVMAPKLQQMACLL